MSEKSSSQAQQNPGSTGATGAAGATGSTGSTAGAAKAKADESINKMETFFREIQKMEEKNVETANRAVDESARLWKETIAYGVRLSNEWRALALKTTRQAAEMMSASFPS